MVYNVLYNRKSEEKVVEGKFYHIFLLKNVVLLDRRSLWLPCFPNVHIDEIVPLLKGV